jgi:hypothetical protein
MTPAVTLYDASWSSRHDDRREYDKIADIPEHIDMWKRSTHRETQLHILGYPLREVVCIAYGPLTRVFRSVMERLIDDRVIRIPVSPTPIGTYVNVPLVPGLDAIGAISSKNEKVNLAAGWNHELNEDMAVVVKTVGEHSNQPRCTSECCRNVGCRV